MLTLADIPYQFVDVSGFDHEGTSRELLKTLNPLCQIPTLALENDEIMTETAAIALMVLDRRPDLAPPLGRAERQQFQRLLVWLVANVYPTFTFADYPERWAPDAPEQLKKNVIEYRKSFYIWLNSQLTAEPYAFGDQLPLSLRYAHMGTRGMNGFKIMPRISVRLLMLYVRYQRYKKY